MIIISLLSVLEITENSIRRFNLYRLLVMEDIIHTQSPEIQL